MSRPVRALPRAALLRHLAALPPATRPDPGPAPETPTRLPLRLPLGRPRDLPDPPRGLPDPPRGLPLEPPRGLPLGAPSPSGATAARPRVRGAAHLSVVPLPPPSAHRDVPVLPRPPRRPHLNAARSPAGLPGPAPALPRPPRRSHLPAVAAHPLGPTAAFVVTPVPALRAAVADDVQQAAERPEEPVLVPVRRRDGAQWWPGDGAVAWVPAELLLASAGRCSCPGCVTAYVAHRARRSLRVVQGAGQGTTAQDR